MVPIRIQDVPIEARQRQITWKVKLKPCLTDRKVLLHTLKIHKAMMTADTCRRAVINGLHCIRMEQADCRNPLTSVPHKER